LSNLRVPRKLRISIVQYLNTSPLVWGFTNGPLQGKYDLSFTVPSLCAEALRRREADLAIIPAIEYQRIPNLTVLPGLAIASKGRVRSLLIVSTTPIAAARSIALDASSRSTQALTRILCHQHWKISPQFLEMPPDAPAMLQRADAALLIGDPALRLSIAIEPSARLGASGEQLCSARAAGIALPEIPSAAGTDTPVRSQDSDTLHIYDVVEQWRKLTGLPAVLAVWAAHREAVNPEVVADFQSSLAFGLNHLDEIASHGAAELALPKPELHRYLTENIDFTLDEQNLQGLHRFFTFSSALGITGPMAAIQLAATSAVPARKIHFTSARS
jgi:chorismate dehydratase